MTDIETLRSLERVEQATGPDADLARAICTAFDFNEPGPLASVDSAIALVERMLPATRLYEGGSASSSGWKIGLYRGPTPSSEKHAVWECMMRPHGGKENWCPGRTAPLAILSALLRALIAKHEDAK